MHMLSLSTSRNTIPAEQATVTHSSYLPLHTESQVPCRVSWCHRGSAGHPLHHEGPQMCSQQLSLIPKPM